MKLPKISSCDRIEFILTRIQGKKVLHLGCADWPFTQGSIHSGKRLVNKFLRKIPIFQYYADNICLTCRPNLL
jgi:hypothetical protein